MTTANKGIMAGIAALVVGLGGGYALGTNYPAANTTNVATFNTAENVAGTTTLNNVFQDRQRELWAEHVMWVKEYINAVALNTQNQTVIQDRLIQNADDIGNELALGNPNTVNTTPPATTDTVNNDPNNVANTNTDNTNNTDTATNGDTPANNTPGTTGNAGDTSGTAVDYNGLFRTHVAIVADLIRALKANDSAGISDAEERGRQNAADIAAALSARNTTLARADVESMINDHMNLTRTVAVQVFEQRWEESIASSDRSLDHALQLADTLAAANGGTGQTGQFNTPSNISPNTTPGTDEPTPQPGLGVPPPSDGPLTPSPSPSGNTNY